MSLSPPPYVLIGSQHSLFTGKLRAYLQWRNLPFLELTASGELYRQVILPRTGVAFIPVLVMPDRTTVLQDTHAIISHLELSLSSSSIAAVRPATSCSSTQQAYPMPRPLLPSCPKAAAASQLLELYGDEWLVLPAMHFRWSFPQQRQRLLYQFGSTNTPSGTHEQQLAAGAKVAGRFAGMLPGLGITPDSIPFIEARFGWQLAVLQEHFQHHAYLLGSVQPSSADFGFIGPLLAHLYIDPVPGSLLQCSAPLVADYVERLGALGQAGPRVVDRVMQHGGGAAVSAAAAVVCGGFSSQAAATAGAAVGGGVSSQAAASSSRGNNSLAAKQGVLAGLQPADPTRPQEGLLVAKTLQLRGGKTLTPTSAAAAAGDRESVSAGSSCIQAGDGGVPRAVLLLLHHMFLEQVPVMLSTLKLLSAWARQQQQQQHDRSGSSSGGWLQVPRFLGNHTFTLYDPATGAALPVPPSSAPLQRMASSYVAWRAAEIVGWYLQLSAADQGAVQELLREVTAVAEEGGSSSSSGGGGGCAATATASGGSSTAAGGVLEGQGGEAAVAARVCVDAVAAFADLVQGVGECGRIERRANIVVVWCEAPCQPVSRL